MNFDPDKTVMIAFDTEWYANNNNSISSLKINPLTGRFIGGLFVRIFPLNYQLKKYKAEIFVDNNSEIEEKKALKNVYDFFYNSWNILKGKNNNEPDLITLGIGISRFDIPALFARSWKLNIDNPENLYEMYMKTKVVDLSEVGIPLIKKDNKILYPVTANDLSSVFDIESKKKKSGINVWKMYESNDFCSIKKRNEDEVCSILKIYNNIINKLYNH